MYECSYTAGVRIQNNVIILKNNVTVFLLNLYLSYDMATPPLGTYPEERKA